MISGLSRSLETEALKSLMQPLLRVIPSLLAVFTATGGLLLGQIVGGPGPSVLSRGGNAPGGRGDAPIDFTFFGGVNTGYESGIYIPVVNGAGEVTPQGYANVGVNVGAYGAHAWRRSSIGLDYRGDYRHYMENTYLNGSDHALALEYRNRISRRWEFVAREAAGTTSRPFGGFASPAYISTDYISVPLTEIYNNRVYYTQSAGHAAYRSSARTMYTMGGGFFNTIRQSRALINSNGYYATGMWQRQIKRGFAIGAGYNYMKFTYPRAFGGADVHGASAVVDRAVGKSSLFSLAVGIYRLEFVGTQDYLLSPEIAAILGRPTGVRVFHDIHYDSQVNAAFVYRRRQISYNVGYTRGATPGNGVYLTSQTDAASAGVSYTGRRRFSGGLNASYTRMRAFTGSTVSTVPFVYYGAGLGMGYRLGHNFNWTMQADWRNINAGQTIQGRNGFVVTTGLMFSSTNIPLSLW